MMKNVYLLSFLMILLLTGCGQSFSAQTTTPTSTATLTPLVPLWQKYSLSSTPPSGTPPPSPTMTPSRPARPIISSTPIPEEEQAEWLSTPQPVACPQENPDVVADFPLDTVIDQVQLLDYLNLGGSTNILTKHPRLLGTGKVIDLTGDGIKEILMVLVDSYSDNNFFIFECSGGKYKQSPFHPLSAGKTKFDIQDLNQNGIPELILTSGTPSTRTNSVKIYEWDGLTYRSLIWLQRGDIPIADFVYIDRDASYVLRDTNADNRKEIIMVDETWISVSVDETITLGWDGKNYINITPGNYDEPYELVQALVIADKQVRLRNYLKALKLYQRLTTNTTFAWSAEWTWWGTEPTPTPMPKTDQHTLVAAYAYYRLMVLYTYLHKTDLAMLNYNTLQKKFASGLGQPYAEMATAFWQSYQYTLDARSACRDAIYYAEVHESEILSLFNRSTFYRIYAPKYICRFE